jgi:hypothetical protein
VNHLKLRICAALVFAFIFGTSALFLVFCIMTLTPLQLSVFWVECLGLSAALVGILIPFIWPKAGLAILKFINKYPLV